MPEQYPLAELSDIEWRLSDRLRCDPEFRKEYFRAELEDSVPELFKGLRERRELTQAELAELVGTKQSGISRFEKSTDAAWQFDFLLRMAEAMDARFRVIVEAAEDVLGEYDEPAADAEASSALANLELKPCTQQRGPSALNELGCQNESREHRSEQSGLSGLRKINKGGAFQLGHASRSSQTLQFSTLSGAAASSGI